MWRFAPLAALMPALAATAAAPWPLDRLPVTTGGAGRPGGTVLLTSFGGRGDGAADNTAAFARALAHLHAAGGGTLVVPSGGAVGAQLMPVGGQDVPQ